MNIVYPFCNLDVVCEDEHRNLVFLVQLDSLLCMLMTKVICRLIGEDVIGQWISARLRLIAVSDFETRQIALTYGGQYDAN
jgi:hypothetical protein